MNITTKICLGATILFSIVGIVIGFSKKGAISSLKEKYDQAKVAENQLASKQTEIINLQSERDAAVSERDKAKSNLASVQQDASQALADKGTADQALATANEEHDATKEQLKNAKKSLTLAQGDQQRWLAKKAELEAEIAKLKRRRGAPPAATTPKKNPTAAAGVQGKVLSLGDQFVVINIGANKGLKIGSVLEVWDGQVYIGKISVTNPAPLGNASAAIANIDSGATTGRIVSGHLVKLISP